MEISVYDVVGGLVLFDCELHDYGGSDSCLIIVGLLYHLYDHQVERTQDCDDLIVRSECYGANLTIHSEHSGYV